MKMPANGNDASDHDWGPFTDMEDDFEIEGEENHIKDANMEEFCSSSERKFKRGSIAQRRAAKLGFDVSRINVSPQFKNNFSSSSSSSPSFFTIPSGISPAALLESPVMLPNSQISPTTGTFPQDFLKPDMLADDYEGNKDRSKAVAVTTDTFAKIKFPAGDLITTTQIPSASNAEKDDNNNNQAPQSSKFQSDYRKSEETSINKCDDDDDDDVDDDDGVDMSKSAKAKEVVGEDMPWNDDATDDIDKKPCIASIDHHKINQLQLCTDQKETKGRGEDPEQKWEGLVASCGLTRNSTGDGFCWRKYGQKHVKGSEYPRSYYKCNSSSNCPVKKKVERSHNGEITEIIYNGNHNHPQPLPRFSLGRQVASSHGDLIETKGEEGIESYLKVEGTTAGWGFQNKDFTIGNADWKSYAGFERTFLNGIPDAIPMSLGKSGGYENSELGISTIREDEDGTIPGSNFPGGDDADGDESDAKRRKKEIFSGEAYMPSRSTREPRIIFQILSEVDVLEDGYRWRKYGQKVVKGNPNPRSYYKCTSAGCPVRKHVERASEDKNSVITTYEGKHNHIAPTAKTNGTAATTTTPPTTNSPSNGSNHHTILGIPRNHHHHYNMVPNPEIQVQDLSLHYQMKPNLGDLVSDMKLGPSSSMYQMKFPPPLHYATTTTSFVMNTTNRSETQTPSSCIAAAAPVMPLDFPMAIPLNINSNGFVPNNHQQQQQMKEGSSNDLRFFKPKEEKKDDHFYYPPIS